MIAFGKAHHQYGKPCEIDDARSGVLVYLDQSGWSQFQRALDGQDDRPDLMATYRELRHLKQAGVARFFIAGTHYQETWQLDNPARRRRIASVMAELSDFLTLTSRLDLDETAKALSVLLAVEPLPRIVMPFGFGLGHVVGDQQLGYQPTGLHREMLAIARASRPAEAIQAMFAAARETELAFLSAVDPGMPSRVSNPAATKTRSGINFQALQETCKSYVIEREPSADQLRGWLALMWLGTDQQRDLDLEAIAMLSDREGRSLHGDYTSLFASMDLDQLLRWEESHQHQRIFNSLRFVAHRNRNYRWEPGDYADFHALSLAVPYADVVHCDRRTYNIAREADIAKAHGTLLVTDLTNLPGAIGKQGRRAPGSDCSCQDR